MEPTRHDRAPGDETISGETGGETLSGLLTYIVGLALATLLTATSFWAASTSRANRVRADESVFI